MKLCISYQLAMLCFYVVKTKNNKLMKIFIPISLLVIFAACKTTKETTKEVTNTTTTTENTNTSTAPTFKEVIFSTLSEGNNGGFMGKQNVVITSQEKLEEVWNEAYSNYMKKPAVPILNFEGKMVLLTTMGEQNNGGFSIKVASITEHENNVMVIVEENIPDNNCMTTSVITYPYEIVEMPKTIKKIVFKNVEKIYSCEE